MEKKDKVHNYMRIYHYKCSVNMLNEIVYCYFGNAVLFHAYELRLYLQSSRQAECKAAFSQAFSVGSIC